MPSIAESFPSLQLQHLRALAEIAVTDRDALAAVLKGLYPDIPLGVGQGITAAQILRGRFQALATKLATESAAPWLVFKPGPALAYALIADGVPMRVQPDIPDIREEMPAETAQLKVLGMRQTEMFVDYPPPANPRENGVLRFEIAQTQKNQVESVSLYFLNEQSGEQYDVMRIYDGKTRSYFGTLPVSPAAQDVDLTKQFTLEAANDSKVLGGDK